MQKTWVQSQGWEDPPGEGKRYLLKCQDGRVEVRSFSPARTPKLQLSAEQPLTGDCWIPPKKDTPHPREKEKSQQDVRRGEIEFRIKPHTCQNAWRAHTNLVLTRTQRLHRDWARTVFECLLQSYGSAVACRRGRGSGCSRPGYGISSLGGGHH